MLLRIYIYVYTYMHNDNYCYGAGLIDVFHGMGGEDNWAKDFPPQCTKQNSPTDKTDCALWCDDQSCDPCHPNNNGYVQMATIMKKGLGL